MKTIQDNSYKQLYICYLPAGRSVLGKTVPELCPQAEGRAQDQGHSFSQYGPTPANNVFIFFSVENYFIRNIFVDFFTAAVSHRARAFDVSVK